HRAAPGLQARTARLRQRQEPAQGSQRARHRDRLHLARGDERPQGARAERRWRGPLRGLVAMSRVGKKEIELPKGVTAQVSPSPGEGRKITVKGPKGQLEMAINSAIEVEVAGSKVQCKRKSELGPDRAAHGLVRALIANMAHGVSTGFERKLEINGVG